MIIILGEFDYIITFFVIKKIIWRIFAEKFSENVSHEKNSFRKI